MKLYVLKESSLNRSYMWISWGNLRRGCLILRALKIAKTMVRAVVEEEDETDMEPGYHLRSFQEASHIWKPPTKATKQDNFPIFSLSFPGKTWPYRDPYRQHHLGSHLTILSGQVPYYWSLKRMGGIRFCTDFRKLNSVSCFDSYPMPRIDELNERTG